MRLRRVLSAQGTQLTPRRHRNGAGLWVIVGMAEHVWQFEDGHVSTTTDPDCWDEQKSSTAERIAAERNA